MKNRSFVFAFFVFAIVALAIIGALLRVRSEQSKRLEIQKQQMEMFSSQKDSITQVLSDATKSISDVYAEVSNLAGAVAVTRTLENIDNVNYKTEVAKKLQAVSSIVSSYKSQMKNAESKLSTMKQQNAALAKQVTVLEETIIRLKDVIQTQEQRINQLVEQLEMTKAERDRFKAEALAKAKQLIEKQEELTKTQVKLTDTEEELNTAYYIIGTINDLSAKGIIEKKGSVLIFGGAWKPVDSLRVDSINFTKINIKQTLEIPMKSKYYRIISPHNQQLLKPAPNTAETVPYQLKIAKPEKFWLQSKVLILSED